jgi:hypothetical protein
MLRFMLYVGMVLSIRISAKTLQNIHVDGLIIVIGWFSLGTPVSSINKDVVESGVKYHNPLL